MIMLAALSLLAFCGCCSQQESSLDAPVVQMYASKTKCFSPANFFQPGEVDGGESFSQMCEYAVEKDDDRVRLCFVSRLVNHRKTTAFALSCADYDQFKKLTGN